MLAARRPQCRDERAVEYVAQLAPDRGFARHAIEALERAVPTDDPFLRVEHDESVIERFQDVLVELPHAAELFGLEMQLAIQTAVFNRGCDLTRDRGEQAEVFAV